MDVILIIIGILTIVLTIGYASEHGAGRGTLVATTIALVLLVTGSNISGMVSTVSTIEHNNVFSLPVDGGQLEFFDPVDAVETVTHYPWYISGGDRSEFTVKGTK